MNKQILSYLSLSRKILSLLFFLIASANLSPLLAQDFTDMFDGYQCARFASGDQFIVRTTETGFELFSQKSVRNELVKERRRNAQKLNRLNEIKRPVLKLKPKSKVVKILNKLFKDVLPNQPLFDASVLSEREQALNQVRNEIKRKIEEIKVREELIKNCSSGKPLKKGIGSVVSPTVQAVKLRGTLFNYVGVLRTAPKLKVSGALKPQGYSACIKSFDPETGNVNRFYAGFGTALCFEGEPGFDTVPLKDCNALLPKGLVGILTPRETPLSDLSEEALDRAYVRVLNSLPITTVLAFVNNTSREDEVKACNNFKPAIATVKICGCP